jgi:hypothetical protein
MRRGFNPKKLATRTTVFVLLLVSALSVYYSLALILKLPLPIPHGLDTGELLVTLVSLIGVYLAVDHLATTDEIVSQIERMEEAILRSKGGDYYANFAELWSRITHLATHAEHEILALVANDEFIPAKHWEIGLAARLREAFNSSRTYIRYDLLIITSKEPSHPDCRTAIDGWNKWKSSLPPQLHEHVRIGFRKSQPICVTAIVVDQKHVCIGFASKGRGNTDTGLVFENSPELAVRIATWFNMQFVVELSSTHAA